MHLYLQRNWTEYLRSFVFMAVFKKIYSLDYVFKYQSIW
jgi:hypothetical protein